MAGLAHADESGFDAVGLEVDRADDVLRVLVDHGFSIDLDLVVHDSGDSVAAYGLFWYDPQTATGLVEPMRTEHDHQRRGLARHILTTGIDLLVDAGAERVKICYELDNAASRDLYLSVGFETIRQTVVISRPARRSVGSEEGVQLEP